MRYFYDCEFLEDGRTIDLISIGIVAEDGREYYAVSDDAPWDRVRRHAWLMANVVPSLPGRITADGWRLDRKDPSVKHDLQIADEVRDFLLAGAGPVELWAWYGAYDHVALCQLYGPMIALPEGLPMYTRDLKQECDRLGNPRLPEQPDGVHNALADARHNLERWRALRLAPAVANVEVMLNRGSLTVPAEVMPRTFGGACDNPACCEPKA